MFYGVDVCEYVYSSVLASFPGLLELRFLIACINGVRGQESAKVHVSGAVATVADEIAALADTIVTEIESDSEKTEVKKMNSWKTRLCYRCL